MADILTPEQRSAHMSRISGKNTKPEIAVRSGLHKRGFRYSLHRKDLPGRPDIVLPKHNAVVFVQGCFWHGHDCPLFKWPGSRKEWWREKLEGNRARDIRIEQALAELGWRQARVWECALKGRNRVNPDVMLDLLADWIRGQQSQLDIRGSSG